MFAQSTTSTTATQAVSAPIVYKIKHGRDVRFIEPVTGDATEWDMRPAVAVRRLALPYVACIGPDEQEYLLNRDYVPLYSRAPGEQPRRVRAGELGTFRARRYRYHDGTAEKDRVAAGRAAYAGWGITVPAKLTELVQ